MAAHVAAAARRIEAVPGRVPEVLERGRAERAKLPAQRPDGGLEDREILSLRIRRRDQVLHHTEEGAPLRVGRLEDRGELLDQPIRDARAVGGGVGEVAGDLASDLRHAAAQVGGGGAGGRGGRGWLVAREATRAPAGLALDELHRDAGHERHRAPEELLPDPLDRDLGQAREGLRHGGERGVAQPREGEVVEAGDGDVVRDAPAVLPQRGHGAERHGVVGGDHGVERDAAPEDRLHRGRARAAHEIAGLHQRRIEREAVPVEHLPVHSQSLLRLRVCGGSPEEREPAPPVSQDQMLDHRLHARAVVDQHARDPGQRHADARHGQRPVAAEPLGEPGDPVGPGVRGEAGRQQDHAVHRAARDQLEDAVVPRRARIPDRPAERQDQIQVERLDAVDQRPSQLRLVPPVEEGEVVDQDRDGLARGLVPSEHPPRHSSQPRDALEATTPTSAPPRARRRIRVRIRRLDALAPRVVLACARATGPW